MTERLSEERLSELEVARRDARWAPQRRWWAEGDRVYINAGLGTYLLAEFSHASDAEYAVTSVNAVDDLLTEVRELRRELADSQAKREQAEAQVAVMDGRLRSLVDTADCEQCIAKSPIGCAGEACSITHIKRMVESVPNVAKILLAEREKMRTALADIADDTTGGDDVTARLDWCRQRAREALREGVMP